MEEFSHEQIHYETETGLRLSVSDFSSSFVAKHWHNGFEILYIIDGNLSVNINGRDYLLEKNGFAVINSKTIHSTVCRGKCKNLLLQIPYETLKKNIPDIDFCMIRCICPAGKSLNAKQQKIRDILERLKQLYESPEDNGYLLMVNSIVYELLYYLVINFKTGIDPALKKKSDRNIQRLGVVLQYVRQHYAESITLSDAAGIVALNREYFSRFFRRYMGMTFMDYVFAIRLEHAYYDIIGSDFTIGEIADQNGFEKNYKIFVRKFKEQYGCSPGEVRKQSKSPENS